MSYARDLASTVGEIKGAPDTFSSWSRCMSKPYCKWPAIIGIIIGSLIVISLLWCCISCLCCGASCCGSCFSCCGNCCGRRRSKGQKPISNPTPIPFGARMGGYQPTPQPPAYMEPQFATFDVSKKGHKSGPSYGNEDALPAMPSWETAQQRKVLEESRADEVEMGRLNAPGNAAHSPMVQNQEYGQAGHGAPYGAEGGYRGVQPSGGYGQTLASPYHSPVVGTSASNNYDAGSFRNHDPIGQPMPYGGRPTLDTSYGGANPTPSYTAYSPQSTGITPANSQLPTTHAPPAALTPGRREQESWTVV
ncbi:MAG: hypothetical protein M1817_002101 [Caeruleum heppii]|nr:MAG: hypothetical protein M1817_002101 [Caeruleum heppii]